MSAFTTVTGYELVGLGPTSTKVVIGTAVGPDSYDATTGSVMDLSSYFNGDMYDVQCEAQGLVGYQGTYVAGTGPDDGAIYLFEGQVTGSVTHGAEVTNTTALDGITFQFIATGTDG